MEITISWIFNIIVTLTMSVIGWSLKEQYKQIKTDKQETREYIKENVGKLDTRVGKIEAPKGICPQRGFLQRD